MREWEWEGQIMPWCYYDNTSTMWFLWKVLQDFQEPPIPLLEPLHCTIPSTLIYHVKIFPLKQRIFLVLTCIYLDHCSCISSFIIFSSDIYCICLSLFLFQNLFTFSLEMQTIIQFCFSFSFHFAKVN